MIEQNETADLREERIRLERAENGELRLSWLKEEKDLPVKIYWSPRPQFEERESTLIAAFAGPIAYGFSDPQPEGRSYYHIRLGEQMLPPVAERIVPLRNVLNFRDLGGYPAADGRRVQWGKLYRSADLSRMDGKDLRYARSLGIAWICDLRTSEEARRYPSPRIESEVNELLSFMASADPGELAAAASGMTVNMLADMNRQMVGYTKLAARFMRRLLDQQGASILFHCAAGKDRTGFVSWLILQALGVDRKYILSDYTLTNRFAERLKGGMDEGDPVWAKTMERLPEDVRTALLEAKPSYLQAAFDELDRKYGNFETYWTSGLGLTAEELRQLRDQYLQ